MIRILPHIFIQNMRFLVFFKYIIIENNFETYNKLTFKF